MKFIVILMFGFLTLAFSCCTEKSQNKIILIKVPNIYFNDNDGKYTHENGIFLRNGKSYSGNLVMLYSEYDTAGIIPFYNGLEEGWSRKYYTHKKTAEERLYHLGRKEGTHIGWWENGQLKFIYQFKNDNHEGKAQTWYPGGQLATDNFYEKGYETGLQRSWYPDGVLRANYDARNGRQYGLTGVKNCESVFDSTTKKFVQHTLAKRKIR